MKELLLVIDISKTWAEAIFRVNWIVNLVSNTSVCPLVSGNTCVEQTLCLAVQRCCLQSLGNKVKRAVRVGDSNSKVARHANQFVHSIDFDYATIVDKARDFHEVFSRGYIQLYTYRNTSPRYSHNLHSCHSYECWWSIPPDLQNYM